MHTAAEIKKLFDEKYKPFNFSTTKCFVLTFTVEKTGVYKIEEKLPIEIKNIKSFFVTANIKTASKKIGLLTLSFNEGQTNPIQHTVINTNYVGNTSQPIPLNETIKTNSLMQGYFQLNELKAALPMTLTVYLHYTE